MRLLAILTLSIILFHSTVFAEELDSSTAKLNFRKLSELLLERVFAKEGNEEIEKRYQEFLERQKMGIKKMQEAFASGNYNPMEYTKTVLPGIMQDQKKIDNYAKAELLLVIEELYPNRFKLIINETYNEPILYSSFIIPDITPNIKQYLLKNQASVNTK
jgi:hypothetical protein